MWKAIVFLRDVVLFIATWLWYWSTDALDEFLDSRIPLLFTHGKTMKYKGYQVTHVVFGYASLDDYMYNTVSYYYVDGPHIRIGKIGDAHWNHCQFSDTRS